MGIEDKCKLRIVSKCLLEEFKAQEISKEEFLSLGGDISAMELSDSSVIYKISYFDFIRSLLSEHEKSEIQVTIEHFNNSYEFIECSSYEYQISTGNLIIIILESIDGENLDSFIMDGIGEFLFNCLSKFIGEDVEVGRDALGEIIEELKQFRPYGKYFK